MRRRVSNSLRARLLLLLFAAVVITAAIQAFIAYRAALNETNEIFDYQMQQMALSLRSGLNGQGYSNGFRQDEDDSFEFITQVSSEEGRIVFQSSPTALPLREASGFSLFEANATTYKLYSLRHGKQLIQVAQDRAARRDLARNLAIRTTLPIVVMVALLLVLVWWVVTSSLAPLNRVQQHIALREAESLNPIDTRGLPTEVRPLVDELNLLLLRLHQAFHAQKSFVADAAHELRSPLSALKLQVEQLRRAATEPEREKATQRLGSGIDRATRLVEQLMVLARQQALSEPHRAAQPLEVNRLCLLAFNDVYPLAQPKHIDMGLMQADECYVLGQEEALRIMLRNILDNAVKYSPEGSRIDLRVLVSARSVSLLIEDSGPGIAEAELERVMDRFHRVAGNPVSGSGLGLAIVKTIAELHAAKLQIGKSEQLGGLAVRVSLEAYRMQSMPHTA